MGRRVTGLGLLEDAQVVDFWRDGYCGYQVQQLIFPVEREVCIHWPWCCRGDKPYAQKGDGWRSRGGCCWRSRFW